MIFLKRVDSAWLVDGVWLLFIFPTIIPLIVFALVQISIWERKKDKARECVRRCTQNKTWPCSDEEYRCKLRNSGICGHVKQRMKDEWLSGLDPYGKVA